MPGQQERMLLPSASAIFSVALLAVKTKPRFNTKNTYREMLSACIPHQYQLISIEIPSPSSSNCVLIGI